MQGSGIGTAEEHLAQGGGTVPLPHRTPTTQCLNLHPNSSTTPIETNAGHNTQIQILGRGVPVADTHIDGALLWSLDIPALGSCDRPLPDERDRERQIRRFYLQFANRSCKARHDDGPVGTPSVCPVMDGCVPMRLRSRGMEYLGPSSPRAGCRSQCGRQAAASESHAPILTCHARAPALLASSTAHQFPLQANGSSLLNHNGPLWLAGFRKAQSSFPDCTARLLTGVCGNCRRRGR